MTSRKLHPGITRKEAVRAYHEIAAELSELQKRVKSIDQMTAIQCSDGNWNFNEYMRGMANGLLLAQATLHNRDYEPLGSEEESDAVAQAT